MKHIKNSDAMNELRDILRVLGKHEVIFMGFVEERHDHTAIDWRMGETPKDDYYVASVLVLNQKSCVLTKHRSAIKRSTLKYNQARDALHAETARMTGYYFAGMRNYLMLASKVDAQNAYLDSDSPSPDMNTNWNINFTARARKALSEIYNTTPGAGDAYHTMTLGDAYEIFASNTKAYPEAPLMERESFMDFIHVPKGRNSHHITIRSIEVNGVKSPIIEVEYDIVGIITDLPAIDIYRKKIEPEINQLIRMTTNKLAENRAFIKLKLPINFFRVTDIVVTQDYRIVITYDLRVKI